MAVIEAASPEVRGRVLAVSTDSLMLNVEGVSRQFGAADVRQIRRDGDPLWNGLVIGAAIGALANAMSDDRCSGQPARCDDHQIPARVGLFSMMTAAGLGIDLLHRDRTVLYVSPGRVTVRIVPRVNAERRGVSIAIGFSSTRP